MRTVITCDLRGPEIPCAICGHIPPDFCGALVPSDEPVEVAEDAEGTDTSETPEEAVSDAPKGRKRKVHP